MEYKQLYLCRKCQSWYGMNPEESLKGCPDCKAELEYVPVDYSSYTSWPKDEQKAFWAKYLNNRDEALRLHQNASESVTVAETTPEADSDIDETNAEKYRKKITGAIILLAVLWMSAFGEGLETSLRLMSESGVSQQMSTHATYSAMGRGGFVYSLVVIGTLVLIMMPVPLICRLVHKKRLSHAGGNQLCLWNSIILFFLPMLFGTSLISIIHAICFYFINKWFFVENKPVCSSSDE